jgi:hypothetical protein
VTGVGSGVAVASLTVGQVDPVYRSLVSDDHWPESPPQARPAFPDEPAVASLSSMPGSGPGLSYVESPPAYRTAADAVPALSSADQLAKESRQWEARWDKEYRTRQASIEQPSPTSEADVEPDPELEAVNAVTPPEVPDAALQPAPLS